MARWERLIDMQLNIAWGSSLERMADDLFRRLGECRVGTAEIFAKRDCIVVPNRIQQAWLQHHFLFDMPRGATPHVLANCDFPPFNLFINDWLNRISPAEQTGRPDPPSPSKAPAGAFLISCSTATSPATSPPSCNMSSPAAPVPATPVNASSWPGVSPRSSISTSPTAPP